MTQQVTEAFDWGFQRDSKAQLAYEAPKKVLPTLGQHGDNVRVGGGVIATRTGGSDASAVVVGSTGIQLMHPAQRGQGTFSWTIRKSQGNDGLGLYVGVADADADFLSDSWGKAWAMGCHGCNLFAWNDARGNGALVPGGLPGPEGSRTGPGHVPATPTDVSLTRLHRLGGLARGRHHRHRQGRPLRLAAHAVLLHQRR
mmetsp:Transcript_1670/g.4519  ORF Transcript_1670/g.4519 Transcript_1670/m.4519 type:complete len:199 (-) Transcript_1670:450-1046(-)